MAKDWKGFERDVAKALGAWAGCVFRRTPGSGAWGKQGQSRFSKGLDATTDFHGDIVAPAEAKFPFSVECKTYKTVDLYQALYGKSAIYEWWTQCERDARSVNLAGMLVFKENCKTALIAVSDTTWNQLKTNPKIHELRRIDLCYRLTKGTPRTLHIFSFPLFLAVVPYDHAKKVVRRVTI